MYNRRYIDDVFFTSNEPRETIQKLLEDANTWHPNIKLQAQISTSLSFLDVLVSNCEGVLHTEVYHKPSAEPYVVPFISDHPRHTFANVIQTALVRAVRYSSTFETFLREQVAVELMLLYNGFVYFVFFWLFDHFCFLFRIHVLDILLHILTNNFEKSLPSIYRTHHHFYRSLLIKTNFINYDADYWINQHQEKIKSKHKLQNISKTLPTLKCNRQNKHCHWYQARINNHQRKKQAKITSSFISLMKIDSHQ